MTGGAVRKKNSRVIAVTLHLCFAARVKKLDQSMEEERHLKCVDIQLQNVALR